MAWRDSIATQTWLVRIAGAILLLLGLLLIGFTEHADRLRVMGEDALGGFVLSGSEAQPALASAGQLVFVTGAPQTISPARDPQFNISAQVPSLIRKVEMFQWHEIGKGHDYELDWTDHPVDSSKFAQAGGHGNPGVFPFDGARFDSPDVRVQGFKLAQELVRAIPGVEPYTPDLRALPPNMAATFQAQDGMLISSADPKSPRLGDLRVSWQQIAPKVLTVLARAQHGVLVETNDASGQPLTQVQIGKRSLSDVVSGAPQRPRYAWARRVLAILLGWAGALLLLLARRRDGLAALLLAIVPLALLASAFWFGVRNAVAIVLILIAILAAISVTLRWRRDVAVSVQAIRRDEHADGDEDR
ncbi:MAG: TMEM43 family protein [Rhodanobacteraceae bacterium]